MFLYVWECELWPSFSTRNWLALSNDHGTAQQFIQFLVVLDLPAVNVLGWFGFSCCPEPHYQPSPTFQKPHIPSQRPNKWEHAHRHTRHYWLYTINDGFDRLGIEYQHDSIGTLPSPSLRFRSLWFDGQTYLVWCLFDNFEVIDTKLERKMKMCCVAQCFI